MAASGPATPSIAPLPNSSGCFVSRLSVEYDRNVGISAPPAGSAPIGKPNSVPRSHGFHERAQSWRRHPQRAAHRLELVLLLVAARGDVERFANREQADRERRHLHAVQQLRHAERQPRLAGEPVDADEAERQPDEQAGEAADRRIAEGRRHGDEGDAHQREIVLRAEAHRDLDQPGRQKHDAERRNRAGDERADGSGGERRPAAAGLGHLVAFERRRQGRALARRVDQNRSRRAAVHAAVVDAGKHDERAGGIELEGDGKKQRHSQRRPDAGQNTDRGAEHYADQRIEQIHRLHRDGEALEQ